MGRTVTEEERAEIWLDSLPLGYRQKERLIEAAHGAAALCENYDRLRDAVREIAGAQFSAVEERARRRGYLRALSEEYASRGIRCVARSGPLYPARLREAEDAPLVLYCRGDVSLLQTRMLAIVGSRRTLPNILSFTRTVARGLSDKLTVLSGSADGADAAALSGALERGRPVSVLASGHDHAGPACNAGLLAEVARRGLVVSEFPPAVTARPYMYPLRNRILAGLCEKLLCVSAGEGSGALISAEKAHRLGREVLAVPYTPGIASGVGCNGILKEYAKLVDDLVDIAAAFGINLTETEPIALDERERAVYAAICEGTEHVAQIAQKCGLKAAELPAVLASLELHGLIVACGGNRYAKG